jgi:galactonate dehydratase
MKITDIKTYLVEAHRRNWVFIEVETDEGITGVGEATIEPFERTMVTLIEDYKRTVIGKDPRSIEYLWEDRYRGQFLRSDLLVNVALSAIEIACWDIKGKTLGVPCYELFGGPVRRSVPAYGNYWFMKTKMGKTSVGEYAESAARAVENGFRALKWSPFGYAAHSMTPKQEHVTLECVRQVREAVGPDVWLMVDAHGRFDLPQARRLAKGFEEYNLYFFEEPLPPENIDAFVELKRSTTTPIATGERYVARHQFRELLEKYACDYIQPDAIYTGGMNELRKIAMMAETYYCPVIPHNCNGPVCTAATIHASACMPNFRIMEYIPVPERVDVLVEPLVFKNGAFELPTKPGLGVELNKEVFDRYVYKPRDLDHFKEEREIVL